MLRILYYIFIYNILFEGVFEGEKPPPTSLRRGERKKLSGISNPPILADTKREMPKTKTRREMARFEDQRGRARPAPSGSPMKGERDGEGTGLERLEFEGEAGPLRLPHEGGERWRGDGIGEVRV